MANPRNWGDVEACSCQACTALKKIRDRCAATGEPLVVFDVRHYGRGFSIGDINLLFREPASLADGFPTAEAAAARVLEEQSHCDVYMSTWPLKPAGHDDYLWSAETIR